MRKKLGLLTLFTLAIMGTTVSADTFQDVPKTAPADGLYTDQSLDKTYLNLEQFNSENDVQVGVVLVDELGDETIEEAGVRIARQWQIGKADSDKGLLLLIAKKDRKIRIETSNNLATEFTDHDSNEAIEVMGDSLRQGDYVGAINTLILRLQTDPDIPKPDGSASYEQETSSTNDDDMAGFVTFVMITTIVVASGQLMAKMSQLAARSIESNDTPSVNKPSYTATHNNRVYTKKRNDDIVEDVIEGITTFAVLDAILDNDDDNFSRDDRWDNDNSSSGWDWSDSSSGSDWSSSSDWGSSDSGWSSSDWGGDGFDGGGSSGDW